MLKLCKINACSDGMLGLHLSRAPWDPYPWVSGIQDTSNAYMAGIRTGDTVLEVNGFDIIGQKISELAALIRGHWNSGASEIQFLVWRNKNESGTVNQQSLQKFATCLQNIAQLLECPICLEVVKPPGWQCCNGHVLCNSCRLRTTKCSICRVALGPRGRCLVSDKLFTLLAETFPCNVTSPNKDTSCKESKTISTSRPIAAIRYIKRKSKQIVTIKVTSEPTSDERKESPSASLVPAPVTLNKSYHCPTGKSCISPTNPNELLQYPCQVLLYSQWDVLTHLRRVHQLSVTQHYGTYGERIDVQLMNKSISCISLVPSSRRMSGSLSVIQDAFTQHAVEFSSQTYDSSMPPTSNRVLMSSEAMPKRNVEDCESILSNGRTSTASGDEVCANAIDRANDKISGVEMFFVARMPILENVDGEGAPRQGDGNGRTVGAPGNERCAIFIWYCGSEANAKKFQAVIECKRSNVNTAGEDGEATVISESNGFVHSLTKTWNSIRCQKEFLELEFDVTNFFDIVIKAK